MNSYNCSTASPKSSPRLNNQSKQKHKKSNKVTYDPRFRRCVEPSEKKFYSSQSELSLLTTKINVHHLSPSTPAICTSQQNNEIQDRGKVDPVQNKFTMTQTKRSQVAPKLDFSHKLNPKHPVEQMEVSLKPAGAGLDSEFFPNSQWRDPRLLEKYSVLKIPWRRTWTIPVISRKSTTLTKHGTGFDNFDRQTYLYDDGTEVDSMYLAHKKNTCRQGTDFKQRALLIIGGAVSGILLFSLLIWLIFGNDFFFHLILKPKDFEDGVLKQYVKYLGGGIIYVASTLIRGIVKVLTVPVQNVFQPPLPRLRLP